MPTKRELLDFTLAHRDAGTLTGKLIKKIRKQALALMFETRQGDFMDMDLLWIGAGCPTDKTPHAWLNGPGKQVVEDLADKMGVAPSDLVVTDDRTVN